MQQDKTSPTIPAAEAWTAPPTLRARGFIAGSAGTVLLGIGVPYATMIIKGSYMDLDFSTPGAIFLFFALAAGINTALCRFLPKAALSAGELAVAYIMMSVACAVTTMGLSAQLIPLLTGAAYYATPENGWSSLFQPHLRPWLTPQSHFAVFRLYEGLKGGESIPWRAWAVPLACWIPFLLTLHFVGICMMIILRAQWSEHERLPYPLVQLPAELSRSSQSSFYRNVPLWMGFGLAFGIGCLIGLRAYLPLVPTVQLDWSFLLWRNTLSMTLRISLPMIGFFYLANTEITFSLWFFYLLSWWIHGEMNVLGIESRENLSGFGSSSPIFGHLGTGATIAFVVSGLWTARAHLAAVLRRALRGDPSVDDRQEVLSYRVAFWGICLGLLGMAAWLVSSGIPPGPMLFFLMLAYLLFIGLTRIVVESGLAEAMVSTIAPAATVSALGTASLGPSGIAGLSLGFVWCSDIRTFVMASTANGLKLAELTSASRRRLFGALIGALVLALTTSLGTILVMAYRYGGVNLSNWFFHGAPYAASSWAAHHMLNPERPNVGGWLLTGLGAVFTFFLAAMRQRYLWWPFHPIGFMVGTTWVMDMIWFSAFIAWMLKALLVRYGGLRMFQNTRPFFLGLILGQFTCNGLWLVIDGISGQRGNQIFWM